MSAFLRWCVVAAASGDCNPLKRAGELSIAAGRLLVGVAPGSTADVSLRILALKLSQILGGQFVVENRTGAGTSIAAQMVVQAPKDGYTQMYGGSANTVNATLSPNLTFDFAKDPDPVARIASVPNILVVHPH